MDCDDNRTVGKVKDGKTMYSFESRIRYSETDSTGSLTLLSLLNYFQDCTTFHSEDVKVGLEYLKEKHLVWVLSAWQIEVLRYPQMGESVKISTIPYEFRKFFGSRSFLMQTADGELLAKANSLWTLLDTDTFKPSLPTEEMKQAYVLGEKVAMDREGRKIIFPAEFEQMEPIEIKKHHLDTNNHVNNGQYISMAMEYLPEQFQLNGFRAEYKKQAFLGDLLYPQVVVTEGKCVVNLVDGDGKSYVTAEFTKDGETC